MADMHSDHGVKNTKVLNILVLGSKPGKGSPHIDKFLPTLAKTGHRITHIGWDRNREFPRGFEEDGVVHRHIFRGGGYGAKNLMVILPIWCMRLLAHLLFRRADLIIAADLDTAFPAAVVCALKGIPLVYVILDQYAMRPTIPRPLRAPIQTVDNWVMRCSDYIIVPDETRIPPGHGDDDRFLVVYNCAPDIADSIPDGLKERRGKPMTVYATGRLLKDQGIGLLLDVAEQMPNVHLLLAGDVHESDVLDRFNSLPRATFLGRIPLRRALELYFETDIVFTFYQPTCEINRRAASNKWSDAMMASRPILANAELVKAGWIRQNDIGYLCSYDTDSLRQCLESIASHREEARQKGLNGRRLYEEGYNWPAMERRLFGLLDRIVNTEPLRSGRGQGHRST